MSDNEGTESRDRHRNRVLPQCCGTLDQLWWGLRGGTGKRGTYHVGINDDWRLKVCVTQILEVRGVCVCVCQYQLRLAILFESYVYVCIV